MWLVCVGVQAGVAATMLGGIRQIWKEGGIPGFFTGYKCVSHTLTRLFFVES